MKMDLITRQFAGSHERKYEAFAQWLGIEAVTALVPFKPEQIQQALAAGDEDLNTLPLATWDKVHGEESRKPVTCHACGQVKPIKPHQGVYALFIAARIRDKKDGITTPFVVGWSLCYSGCVLKHVAKYHLLSARQ